MSTYINTMAKLAFANTIALSQAETMDSEYSNRQLFVDLSIASAHAIKQWPGGKLNAAQTKKLMKQLKEFMDAMQWDNKPVHIQSMINFSLFQLVDLLENHIKDSLRRSYILRVATRAQHIYDAYTAEPDLEQPLCIVEGMQAAALWSSIMEAS